MSRTRICLAAIAGAAAVLVTAPTPAGAQGAAEMPMADYLALLGQIAPAAREGAQAFIDAHRQRCARALGTSELRAAMAHGDGDPVLMAMIRASQLRNEQALAALAARVSCRGTSR